jgi:hypothetical protein
MRDEVPLLMFPPLLAGERDTGGEVSAISAFASILNIIIYLI